MPTNTTNYSLVKPTQEEFYNVDVQNNNMDTIDRILKDLQDAIASGATDQELTVLSETLTMHLNDKSNPHVVTKTQVGLSAVENYGVATAAEAKAGSVNNKYMTPIRTKEAISSLAEKNVSNGYAGLDGNGKLSESVIPNSIDAYVRIASFDFLANPSTLATVSGLSAYKAILVKYIGIKPSSGGATILTTFDKVTGNGTYLGVTNTGTYSGPGLSITVTTSSPIANGELKINNENSHYLTEVKTFTESLAGGAGSHSMGLISLQTRRNSPLETIDFAITNSGSSINAGIIEVWGVRR